MSQTQSTLQRIEEILPELQPLQLKMVLAFAEFVRERVLPQSDDDVMWSFVEREQAYRAAHPEELFVYHTDEELLAALDELS
jgi:hypothetical protein